MAILTVNEVSYTVDHAVKGIDFIHAYDVNGTEILSFEGITDFSAYTYTGTYLTPTECFDEPCNNVKFHGGCLKSADNRNLSPEQYGAASSPNTQSPLSGPVNLTVANNTIYTLTEVTDSFSLKVPDVQCHLFISIGSNTADIEPTFEGLNGLALHYGECNPATFKANGYYEMSIWHGNILCVRVVNS